MATRIWDGGGTDTGVVTAANWSGDTAPTTSDTAIFPADVTGTIVGGATSLACDILLVEPGCALEFGTKLAPILVNLDHAGSNRKATFGGTGEAYFTLTGAKNVVVEDAPASPGDGLYGLNLQLVNGTSNSYTTQVSILCSDTGQSVGLGAGSDIDSLRSAAVQNIVIAGGSVGIGSIAEIDTNSSFTLKIEDGAVVTESAIDSIEIVGGDLTHKAGALALLDANGGNVCLESTATITLGNLSGPSALTCSPDARTITTLVMGRGSSFVDPLKSCTLTNGIDLYRCGLGDVTIDRGDHYNVAFAAV